MSLVPPSVMPHIRRFGWSGAIALAVVVAMMLGINPITLISGQVSPPPPPTSTTGLPTATANEAAVAAYPQIVNGEAELMWRRAFYLAWTHYPDIHMQVVSNSDGFGCGFAGKDMGTFYCPDDQTIYVDTDAYMRLRARFPGGADTAQAVLVAEAHGHHVQWAQKALEPATTARTAGTPDEALEQRLDMQASCYAGMWASTARFPGLYDDPDVVAALAAVEANRDNAILPAMPVVAETLTDASFEAHKAWHEAGYDIPAAGNCSLEKIAAKGLS